MEHFPDWMRNFPEADTPPACPEGRLLASPHGQAVFLRAEEDLDVPPHAHGARWGAVAAGRRELTIDGETDAYEPGDTYDMPAGAEHSARLPTGTCVIDVFRDSDRYGPKG